MFLSTLLWGVVLVVVQGILAWRDGYLTQAQMHSHGVMNGYSFMEHGGMWSDVFIVSPLVAYLLAHYRFPFREWWSWLIFAIAVAVAYAANAAYNDIGLRYPVPHNHDGHITPAGIIHAGFGVVVLWLVVMFYLTPINPLPSARALICVSLTLTPFFFLGMVDFNRRWVFLKGAKMQLATEIVVLWVITLIRIEFR